MKIQHKTVNEVYGPIVVVNKVPNAKYQEIVEIELPDGSRRRGRVLEAATDRALVQMFEETRGLEVTGATATFLGKTLQVGVSPDMVGRVFKGDGSPRDNKPAIIPEATLDINGAPINPFSRDYPNDFIETGISSIDVLNTLVRGQKLPIFSGAGLPHSQLAAQIARQATVRSNKAGEKTEFSVVFGAMGIPFEEAEFFINEFRSTGALDRSVLFINLANDPVIERITLPRFVLTTAEYLAFEKGRHVLVILTDMTNYCEALREVSAARKEVPGRRGYPGYMYTDLATLYERAGRVKGKTGTITQIPILSMPDDDKTHPIPDLTGYITEGQIMMSRGFHNRGTFPGIDVLTSLSRLMPKGIGEGKTREDHSGLSSQLFASYARGLEVKELAVILGESALSETDKKFLTFATDFEDEFINQGNTHRTVEQSLDLGWKLLSSLPLEELKRVKPEHIKKYLK